MRRNLTLDEYRFGQPTPGGSYTTLLGSDEPLFPHRRDVRDMAEEVLHALLAHSDESGEFERDFLTDVRDLMREGVPFEEAVGAFAPMPDEDESLSDLIRRQLAQEDNVFHFLGYPEPQIVPPTPSDEG